MIDTINYTDAFFVTLQYSESVNFNLEEHYCKSLRTSYLINNNDIKYCKKNIL